MTAMIKKNRLSGKKQNVIKAEDAIKDYNKIIVLGKPGAGKTTFLKYLTVINLNKAKPEFSFLPIFISLKELSESKFTLIDYITDEFERYLDEAREFVFDILKEGRFLILLDGLDEVLKVQQYKIIKEIIDLSKHYTKNKFVVSCRVAAYNHWFQTFKDIEIADFNEKQIKNFINNWFKNEEEVANKCWNEIVNDPQLGELSTVPLLLTLLCIAYDESYNFPSNRSELFERAIFAFLEKWDSSRRIKRDSIYEGLTTKRKISLFSRLAIETFENNKLFFKLNTFERIVEVFLDSIPKNAIYSTNLNIRAFIQEIEAQHGIILQRTQSGIYSFAHLTFHEFFVSKYIIDNTKNGTLERLVSNYLLKDEWREIFLLTSAMLEDAYDFLLLIYNHIHTLKEKPSIHFLLNNLDIVLDKDISNNTIHKATSLLAIITFDFTPSKRTRLSIEEIETLDFNLSICEKYSFKLLHELIINNNNYTFYEYEQILDYYSTGGYSKNAISEFKVFLDFEKARLIASELKRTFEENINHAKQIKSFLKICELFISCLNTDCYLPVESRKTFLEKLLSLDHKIA